MGSRKRLKSNLFKKNKMSTGIVFLKNNPISPRKMKLIVDAIRNKNIDIALSILKYSKKHVSKIIRKLLYSGLSNWQLKNKDKDIEDSKLYIKSITVGSGKMLKRLRPAPQGRGHRIRKRSNHVSVIIDSKNSN